MTFYTKIVAFVFGLACVGLAFLAQHLGGVLQISLTIFGVVGGPLLGIFTLGMFTTGANEKVRTKQLTPAKILVHHRCT